MTLSRVGVSKAVGDTCSIPAGCSVGDLILAFAFTTGSAPGLTVATSGWFTRGTANATVSRGLWYKWCAVGDSEIEIPNAEFIHCWAATSDIKRVILGGGSYTSAATGTTLAYFGVPFDNAGGPSWVVASGCTAATDGAIDTAPTGLVNLDSQTEASTYIGASALHDSDGTKTSWSTANASIGGTSAVNVRIIAEVFEGPESLTGGGSITLNPFRSRVFGT